MGNTFIFIMGLICTGTVVAATFLSISELKDVNEPQTETMNMEEGTKRHLKLISTAIFFPFSWRKCTCLMFAFRKVPKNVCKSRTPIVILLIIYCN